MNSLRGFLEPDSIVIVGASQRPGSISALTVESLLSAGFEGRICLVNPKGGELFGFNAYTSLSEVEPPVDLAVFFLPPSAVVDAVATCGQMGIGSVIVVTDGLDRVIEEETTIMAKMIETAKKARVRIIGPDSMGVVNTRKRLSTGFVPIDDLTVGGLSLFSQTGLFTGAGLAWIVTTQGLGISKSIDLAKKCDVDEIDCLEYLGEDRDTKIIAMHIEEIADGKRFIEAARKTATKKPILAIKAGKTEASARAIASHTGSIVGREEAYVAAFTQSGILRIQSFEELVDLAKAFIHLPLLKGKKIAIVTYSGGWGALAADLCEEFGLSIAKLSETTLEKLNDLVPAWREISNPVDIWPPTKFDTSQTYLKAVRAVALDSATDGLLVIAPAVSSPFLDVLPSLADEVHRHDQKPIVICAVGDRDGVAKASSLLSRHLVVYRTVKRAVRALSALNRYHSFLQSL